jgi:peptide/nickel transport system permease protein
MGVVAAWKQNTWIDRSVMVIAVLGFSVPVFVIGYVLAYVFALQLDWFPVQGYTPIARGVLPWLSNLALPSFALGAIYLALIARFTRATMMDVLTQDYIRTARAKGMQSWVVIFRHALLNALIPIVTVVGILTGVLLGGAVVVEQVFSLPGVGRLIIGAIQRRDFPIIQGGLLITAATFVFVNIGVDIIYGWLDPRVRDDR